MLILPPKILLYRDIFNSPPPNKFYPTRFTNPSKLAIISLKVVKRRHLPVPIILVLLSIGQITP
jgi:hypothetical protein